MRKQKKYKKFRNWVAILCIVSVVLITIFTSNNSNKIGKLETNFARAKTPSTENDVVVAALEVASEAVKTQTGYSCSQYVQAVLGKMGYGAQDLVWAATTPESIDIKKDGQTYHPELIVEEQSHTGSWVDRLGGANAVRANLKPGDIVSGGESVGGDFHGHMFIYIGEFSGINDAGTKITSEYNKTYQYFKYSEKDSNLGQDGRIFYQEQSSTGVYGTTFWFIEGNYGWSDSTQGKGIIGVNGTSPNTNIPTFRNYSWPSSDNTGEKNMNNVKVYRISSEQEKSGSYNLKLTKRDKDDNSFVAGAYFKISQDINNSGTATYITKNDPNDNTWFNESTTGFDTVASNVNITSTEQPDIYTIKEIRAPDGYNILGENVTLKLKVTKELDGSTYKISKIEALNGNISKGETTPGGNDILLSGALETSNESDYVIKVALADSGNIEVTWRDAKEDEIPITGNFALRVIKYKEGSEERLTGAKFKISVKEKNGSYVTGVYGGQSITLNNAEASVNANGELAISNINISAENKTYQLTIKESKEPDGGYKKLENDINLEVVSKLNSAGTAYELVPATLKESDFSTIKYTRNKQVSVSASEVVIEIENAKKIYDLALRKYITAVKDGATGVETAITNRVPVVDATKLKSGESTTASYTHTKDPVPVHTTDIVTYNIQVYNEGPEDAYANVIKDDIPKGLEFVPYTKGDGSINDIYGWKLVDENDNVVSDASKAKYIVTNYLDIDRAGNNIIKGFNKDTMTIPNSKIVKVQFKVTEPTTSDRIIENQAQIAKETDTTGNDVKDRDSHPNKWLKEDDEDIEQVKVQYFDLSLRKWVTEAWVIENGKKTVYQTGHKAEDNPEQVVKVDLKKSKVDDVVVKFKYSIRVTNDRGQIPGAATEIRDDIPAGLKFVQEDNPDWREENGQIVTNKLAGTILNTNESAEVEIILTWVNSEKNVGVLTNVAEINKDYNAYGTHDIDSTPGNNVPKEDDIDDAPVMVTVTTGSETIKYIALAVGIITFMTISIVVIKKKILE